MLCQGRNVVHQHSAAAVRSDHRPALVGAAFLRPGTFDRLVCEESCAKDDGWAATACDALAEDERCGPVNADRGFPPIDVEMVCMSI